MSSPFRNSYAQTVNRPYRIPTQVQRTTRDNDETSSRSSYDSRGTTPFDENINYFRPSHPNRKVNSRPEVPQQFLDLLEVYLDEEDSLSNRTTPEATPPPVSTHSASRTPASNHTPPRSTPPLESNRSRPTPPVGSTRTRPTPLVGTNRIRRTPPRGTNRIRPTPPQGSNRPRSTSRPGNPALVSTRRSNIPGPSTRSTQSERNPPSTRSTQTEQNPPSTRSTQTEQNPPSPPDVTYINSTSTTTIDPELHDDTLLFHTKKSLEGFLTQNPNDTLFSGNQTWGKVKKLMKREYFMKFIQYMRERGSCSSSDMIMKAFEARHGNNRKKIQKMAKEQSRVRRGGRGN
jgi:hypothetical protein